MYLSKPAKSLIVAVFAVMIFTIASIWVTSQQIKADSVTDVSTSITDTTPVVQTPPVASTPVADTTSDGIASPVATTSPEAVAQTTATDITPSPDVAALIAASPSNTLPETTTKSRATLHYSILIADGIIVLILLAVLTFRLLGKLLGQPTAISANGTSPTSTSSTPSKPVTIDDLQLDIPA